MGTLSLSDVSNPWKCLRNKYGFMSDLCSPVMGN